MFQGGIFREMVTVGAASTSNDQFPGEVINNKQDLSFHTMDHILLVDEVARLVNQCQEAGNVIGP